MSRGKLSKSVTTPAEYKEAVTAAEVFGLEPIEFEWYGCWECQNDSWAVHPANNEIVSAGRKYFEVQFSDEKLKIFSVDGISGEGSVRVYFG